MINSVLKEQIKNFCLDLLSQKALLLRSALETASESANNETKSSAGDKHETARAMMQLEQEKLSKQLNELREQQEDLIKINTTVIHNQITMGSLIQTKQALIFIATGLGKIHVNSTLVYVVSDQSPLGMALWHLGINDVAELNGVTYQILQVV